MYAIGIDIGSTGTKTAVLGGDGELRLSFVQPTGWSSADSAETAEKRLVSEGIDPKIWPCVATGYGRASVPYADKCVTEISCHAKGAMKIYGSENLAVIDIGGQDTKAIRLEGGAVSDFVMNDKCSAGTGRFLEVMANTLALRPSELAELASRGGGVSISSMCTVFAESEVISLIGRGERKENIAFAVIDSIAKKVAAQAARLVSGSAAVCLTGGLVESEYLRAALEKELRTAISAKPEGRYAGAIGAALFAMDTEKRGRGK